MFSSPLQTIRKTHSLFDSASNLRKFVFPYRHRGGQYIDMVSNTPSRSALRPIPATNTASADFSLHLPASLFQAQGEISPGKNALLRCTTARFTPLLLDHESFAESCPLAMLGNAFYPVLIHRLAVSLHASSPHSVTLMQLRFTSFVVINLRWDFHLLSGLRNRVNLRGITRFCGS